jgi:ABC-type transport system substrate-binding protein
MYMPEQGRNSSHVADPTIISMLKEQMRTQDLETRRKLIFDIQHYAADQQYFVSLLHRSHRVLAAVRQSQHCSLLFAAFG